PPVGRLPAGWRRAAPPTFPQRAQGFLPGARISIGEWLSFASTRWVLGKTTGGAALWSAGMGGRSVTPCSPSGAALTLAVAVTGGGGERAAGVVVAGGGEGGVVGGRDRDAPARHGLPPPVGARPGAFVGLGGRPPPAAPRGGQAEDQHPAEQPAPRTPQGP